MQRRSNLQGARLVDILCYCLMPNHFHLIVRNNIENGIMRFMQKLGTSYTSYFNIRYERSGHLFQGKYKRIEVGTNEQLTYLTAYIHGNPVFARLADTPDRWQWSSYKYFIRGESDGIIAIDNDLFEYTSSGHTNLICDIQQEKQSLVRIADLLLE